MIFPRPISFQEVSLAVCYPGFSASAFQLQQLLREKMKTGYFSMKNLFESYDSKEQSSVSRQDLQRILSTFLSMPITYSQFNRIMKRYGIFSIFVISRSTFFNQGFWKFKWKDQVVKENDFRKWAEKNTHLSGGSESVEYSSSHQTSI